MSRLLALAPLAAALLLGAAGCSSRNGGNATNASHEGALRIAPDPATVTGQVAAVVEVPGVDPSSCRFAWSRNGQLIAGAEAALLDPQHFRKGDFVAVEVLLPAREGEPSPKLRAEVRIADAPPVVRSARVAADSTIGRTGFVALTDSHDPDGDRIHFTYRWFRNGEPVAAADGAKLSGIPFTRGDRVAFEVTASDGDLASPTQRSEEFEIENRAPRFTAEPLSLPADERAYRYQVKASDPDGDPLRYELASGPEGMTVSADGTLDWALPPREGRLAEYAVTIRALDSKGGEATQQFTIRLTPRDAGR